MPNDGKDYIYVEHWPKTTVSITINGKYIKHSAEYEMKDISHPFGEVPLHYIPAVRTNDYFGVWMVERIRGLVDKYNSRFADNGDAVYKNINKKVYIANACHGDIRVKSVKNAKGEEVAEYLDLGEAPTLSKGVTPEPPVASYNL